MTDTLIIGPNGSGGGGLTDAEIEAAEEAETRRVLAVVGAAARMTDDVDSALRIIKAVTA